jgi:hypothetical protein
MSIINQAPNNKRAMGSLALSVVSLLAYAGISARASFALFVVATVGALCAGIIALALGVRARAENKRLAMLSRVVALGYLLALSIVLLNIIVTWMRR